MSESSFIVESFVLVFIVPGGVVCLAKYKRGERMSVTEHHITNKLRALSILK